MSRPWQRIAGCTAAALLTLLLCGCEVRGTVDVLSGTQAEANLIFTDAQVDCLGLTRYAGLVIKGSPDSDGNQTCRAQGTIELDALKDFGIQLSQAGEYVMLDLAMPQQYGFMPTEVDVTFPGTVVESGGLAVTGNSVRVADGDGVTNFSTARVVAFSHPGPEWWVMALVAGFGGGVVLTLAVLLFLRWRRHLHTLQPDADQLPTPDATTPHATLHATSPATSPATTPEPRMTTPSKATVTDHTIWAPPEDQGDR